MVANDEFFQRKQAAAVLKHGILERYATMFTAMAGSAGSGRVHYIDGYAGPGRYEVETPGAVGEPGSPLLAVATATKLREAGRDLRCTFIERDPSLATNLSAVLAAEAGAGLVYDVIEGDVSSHLATAVTAAAGYPLLIFLDPFGTALPFELLVAQMSSRPRTVATEVLLNFNVESVRRIGGLLVSTDSSAGRELTLQRVDGFMGGGWWRETFLRDFVKDQPGTAARAASNVAEEFRGRVAAATGYRSMPVPVRRRPGHEPLFLMTLFYRHDAAPYQFAEAASLANADWRNHHRKIDLAEDMPPDDGLFDVSEYVEAQFEREAKSVEQRLDADWTQRIKTNIVDLVRRHGGVRIDQHVIALYGETLGLAREKHLRAAWDAASTDGVVQARVKGGRLRSQTILAATP